MGSTTDTKLSASPPLGQPVTEAIRNLLEEVIRWHSDPESPEYNECEKDPCLWCECAKGLLAGTMKHDEIVKAIGRPEIQKRENGTRSDSAPKVKAEPATAETRQGRGNRLGVTISSNYE